MKKTSIIGGGISGLSAACYMARAGYRVTVFEKNPALGGRASRFIRDGFVFDTGPTFYWMPDIFEKFFNDFGKSTRDYYDLVRLDPGYEIYFGPGDSLKIPAGREEIYRLFESVEKGSSAYLAKFLGRAEFNYRTAVKKIIYKPGRSVWELVMPETIRGLPQFMTSLSQSVRRNIRSPRLRSILEFPVLFLGAKPSATPSFYCFMNFADLGLGTWHIHGGMYELVLAMKELAESMGVVVRTSAPVSQIVVRNGRTSGIVAGGHFFETDLIISGSDYCHTETLLREEYRNYPGKYWDNRVLAPSALLYYIGFDKKIRNVSHHTLFFDADFDRHSREIYDDPAWPEDPLFYASFPTKTDPGMGPAGKEAAVILIPIAPGLKDEPQIRERYFRIIVERMEKMTGESLKNHILFQKSYSVSNFVEDFNSFRGNAYGLSNILTQTACFKPSVRNRRVSNLFYTGQMTVPGPGVPPALISGKIAAEQAMRYLNMKMR